MSEDSTEVPHVIREKETVMYSGSTLKSQVCI